MTIAPNLPLTVFGEVPRSKVRVPVVIDYEVENMKALHMIVSKNINIREGIRLFYQDKKIFMRLAFHVRRVCRVRLQDCRCSHIGCTCGVVHVVPFSSCPLRLPRLWSVCRIVDEVISVAFVTSPCHHARCVCRGRCLSFIIIALS